MVNSGEGSARRSDSIGGLLLRMYWMAFGNIPLIFFPIIIYDGQKAGLSLYDLFFVLGVLALILARYVDIAYFKGQTAETEPATMQHWKRYAVTVSGIAAAALLLSHGLVALGV